MGAHAHAHAHADMRVCTNDTSTSPSRNDALCKAFCTPSGSLSKAMFPAFSASKLLLENACYFPGMTLTAWPHVERDAHCPILLHRPASSSHRPGQLPHGSLGRLWWGEERQRLKARVISSGSTLAEDLTSPSPHLCRFRPTRWSRSIRPRTISSRRCHLSRYVT